MGSTGAATQKVDVQIPTNTLVKVLVIDDEEPIRESWKRLFGDMGFSVDAAASPDEALELLKTKSYEIIVADISFEDSEITGDQIITENPNLLRKASVVAITGFGKDRIKRIKQLEEMGVRVLEKGGQTNELVKIVTDKLEERKRQMADLAQQSISAFVEKEMSPDSESISNYAASSEYLLSEIRQMLVKWFRTRKDPDQKSILYGGRVLSANELAIEVEKGTEIGREHIEGMIDLFKECLNLQ